MAKATGKLAVDPLYRRIRHILESARLNAARSVNTAQVVANWMIGHAIVERQQAGIGNCGTLACSIPTSLGPTTAHSCGWMTRMRAFYEIETVDNNWSARELERQINSPAL